MVRLAVPFYLPGLVLSLLQTAPENFMTRNNEKQIDQTTCTASKELHFRKVKDLSKKLKITINDLVTCSISSSLRTLFDENGDKNVDKV